MAGATAVVAAASMVEVAVEDSTAVVAGDFTEAVARAAVAVSTEAAARVVDDHSAADSAAARAVVARLAVEDHLAADDQGRLVFAAAHLVARVDSLRVRAVRSEMAGRVPTASME
jgi:hypothetical protein